MNSIVTLLKFLLRPSWACGTELIHAYERRFAQTVIGNDLPALAFGRGRVALWTILRAGGVTQGSEVILPAYTCETVPMAVKFAGAKCVYADAESGQFNASLRDISNALTGQTRVIICQHTYGIMQPMQELISLAQKNQTILVEDRCHLIQNDLDGEGMVTLSQAAYFSTHTSKPFSTGQGGMAVFSDRQLYTAARNVYTTFPCNDNRRLIRSLALQMILYTLTVRPTTRAPIGSIYRWAQRSGLIRGTISVEEYGEMMPSDYLSRATTFQAVLGMAQLRDWDRNRWHRQHLTRFYIEELSRIGMNVSALLAGGADPILLYVPILVENKQEMLRRAARRALPIACWFDRTPAHICPETAYRYDYHPGQCPKAEKLILKEIHLLTAPWVTPRQAQRAIGLIKKYASLVSY
ncbi:MAG: DegT/DnrJ/EryC1/StrS family aminotransferase [Phycisphaerae bacterium]